MSLEKEQSPVVGSLLKQDRCTPVILKFIDGAGLAAGVFNHLLGLENERPKVMAATHFHGTARQDVRKP